MAKGGQSPRGILIVDCNGIGDVVVNLSLYAALRKIFPGEAITLLGHPWVEPLLRYTGLVEFHVAVRVPWAHGEVGYISRSLIEAFLTAWRQRGRFRLGVEFSGDCRNKLMLWLTGAHRRVGIGYAAVTSGLMSELLPFRYFPGDRLLTTAVQIHNNRIHILDQRANCIKHLGYKNPIPRPKLKVNQEELDEALRQLPHKDKNVLVHPGAGSPLKCWPAENHAALIKGLRNRGFAPVLVEGNKEDQLIKAIVRLLDNGQIPIIRPTLRGFLALVAAAKCVICMDSAAAHFAGNLGTPAVVLYGPQSRMLWHPVGGPAALLRNDVCLEHPCLGRKCPKGLPTPCMSSITSSQVLEAFDRIMHEERRRICKADI